MPLVTVITGWTLGKKSTGVKWTLLTVFFLKTAGGLNPSMYYHAKHFKKLLEVRVKSHSLIYTLPQTALQKGLLLHVQLFC